MGTEETGRLEISEALLGESQNIRDEIEVIEEIQPWQDQITVRSLFVGAILGVLFCVIIIKLDLTVGIIPTLNVAAGLLGFFFIKTWTDFLSHLGIWTTPFTKQENTVIQTCIVACSGIASAGGFGSYMLAMDQRTYELIGVDYQGNRQEDVKNPSLGWMIGFLFSVSFLGLFSVVPLQKVMILDYKLTYPSGTATAMLINSFHTSSGAEIARNQGRTLSKYLRISLLWAFFKWFFSGIEDSCGFDNFPSLGLEAFKNTFYFDFNPTYIGCGIICPHIVTCSVLFGAVISWGFLWPFISQHAGYWYPANLNHSDLKGLYGYKVFITIALVLGDGLYTLIKILLITVKKICAQRSKKSKIPLTNTFQVITDSEVSKPILEERGRNETFLKGMIPSWIATSGYIGLAAISMVAIPTIFPPLKWYLILFCYIIAPCLAFCNSYGCGLTDCNMGSTYGKVGLFIVASWMGPNGGVLSGLAAFGVMLSIVSTATDLMNDFKTGYLTYSSPRSMFVSQLIGTAWGCVLAPLTFWMFWNAFDIGSPDGPYKAPYAVIMRGMAILGVEGFSSFPKYCLEMCYGSFVAALVINLVGEVCPKRVAKYIPIPMAMAIPFTIGAYFAIDMLVGTVILYVWERINEKDAEAYACPVASGLICGDGIWSIPLALFSIFKINPPICMSFRPSVSS
ncbi:probable metal-nicotianamine transporter YSL6 isoform X1 [Amborella trichopoda]|uniref:Uncharacterized protein n=1 Tax=Amborella trichopoda TaxID=13333 RepID=W1PF18_AMBTC|nr:probable metal-nicotianamine transporter YSL6 isoform X1 [Amborella trichopoda]ERN06309.1 hypothetical protein AMTR_s00016p00229620 [Amborella trichopoda]|eukprot:XP_006844634.1 probable metal-nicotianamine transporter YSL6 isoform X1 [Amborella trichopoda]